MLDIYKLDDEVLRTDTKDVDKFDSALKILVDAMFETLTEAFIVDLSASDGDKYVFINPEILETSIEEGFYEEGCLSIPGFYRKVKRPLRVKVQAQDLNGKYFNIEADGLLAKYFNIEADGLLARVIQHENDHLHKTLFIDHLEEEEKEKVIKAYRKKTSKKRKK